MVKIKNKKTLLIVLAVVVVVAITIFLVLRRQGGIVQPSPTIVSTTPKNESLYVEENSNIKIIFGEELPEKVRNEVDIKSKPDARFTSNWTSYTTLELIPSGNLQNNTTYNISILYKGKVIKTINFRTNKYSKEDLKEQAREQSQLDYNFAQDLESVFEEIPWLENLPIKTGEYRALYDFDTESIRIRLLIPNASPETEKENARQNALNNITKKGINLEDIPYYFLYQDE